jgi:RNA polymerase sigma factor (sigma-70 family)
VQSRVQVRTDSAGCTGLSAQRRARNIGFAFVARSNAQIHAAISRIRFYDDAWLPVKRQDGTVLIFSMRRGGPEGGQVGSDLRDGWVSYPSRAAEGSDLDALVSFSASCNEVAAGQGGEQISDVQRLSTESWKLHIDFLRSYFVFRVDRTCVDDLCSEAVLQAWRSRGRFDASKGTLRAWIIGIANNVLRQHYRSEARRRAALDRHTAAVAIQDVADDVVRTIDAAHRHHQVCGPASGLTEGEHQLLELVGMEFTYEEISRRLAIPIGTVRSRLSRARAKISRTHSDFLGSPQVAADSAGPGSDQASDLAS